MLEPRRLAALTVALSLALPGGAFAQSAGENQYTDPFEGEEGASQAGGGGSGSSSGSESGSGSKSGSNSGSGGGGGELSTTPPSSTESQAAQTRTPAGELARTGADPGLVALLGAGFILTGAGLRARVRRPVG